LSAHFNGLKVSLASLIGLFTFVWIKSFEQIPATKYILAGIAQRCAEKITWVCK
jgi:hypothetical protein